MYIYSKEYKKKKNHEKLHAFRTLPRYVYDNKKEMIFSCLFYHKNSFVICYTTYIGPWANFNCIIITTTIITC